MTAGEFMLVFLAMPALLFVGTLAIPLVPAAFLALLAGCLAFLQWAVETLKGLTWWQVMIFVVTAFAAVMMLCELGGYL